MFLDKPFEMPESVFHARALTHVVEPEYSFIGNAGEVFAAQESAEYWLEELAKTRTILFQEIVEIPIDTPQADLQQAALDKLNRDEQRIRAEAQKKLTEVTEFRQTLLALTHMEEPES